ncbi:MAG TPA: thioredoxin family protein [Phycisphaerae bacterium]|nr:thioredoxin family protein [Phycisphaerae bacterium]HRW52234.1 thioredoxin family protein [Phycisphaerae bacterium]
MQLRLAACATFFLISSALADAPFEDLSYPAAVKKAKENEKIVLIDFYTTWCGPCKMLDRRTWPDANVQKWLAKHAVCIKVDAEASREFAAKFKVRAYPTIIFVNPEGKVLDRIVGYRGPEAFIEAAEGALSGKDALTRAKEAFESGDTNDPMRRGDYAQKLVDLGEYQKALEHYLWCFDHGEQHSIGYGGVRVSFLLGYIKDLGERYPPAIAALRKRRDNCEKRVNDFIAGKKLKRKKNKQKGLMGLLGRVAGPTPPAICAVTSDLAALNDVLGDNERSIRTYDELRNCEHKNAELARSSLFHRIREPLLAARRYEDYVRDGDPVQNTLLSIQVHNIGKLTLTDDDEITKQILESSHTDAIMSAAANYEACVGADRLDLAKRIQRTILDFDSSFVTYDALVSGAVRANRFDVVRTLGDEAATKLTGEDAERLAKRVQDELSSPAAKAATKKAGEKPTEPNSSVP